MSKFVKNMMIDVVRDSLGETRDLLVIDSSKLDGNTSNRFRLALREKEITALTVQNALARRALADLGVTTLDSILAGPSTLVWGGEDIVALSKEIAKWAREIDTLEIKGGTLEGTSLSPGDVDALSKSPSREELIGQIVGLALSPGANISGALLGMGGKLASQIEQVSESEEAEEGEQQTEE